MQQKNESEDMQEIERKIKLYMSFGIFIIFIQINSQKFNCYCIFLFYTNRNFNTIKTI